MTELKQCPFCGNNSWEFRVLDCEDKEGTPCAYVCEACSTQSPWVYCRKSGEDINTMDDHKLIDTLNTRPVEDALRADRDEELRGRLAAERRLDEVMNAKSALENVVCLEDKWVAVEGGGYHRAVSPDKLGDLYDRLRRARELFAAMAMQGMMAAGLPVRVEQAKESVWMADALLAELAKEGK